MLIFPEDISYGSVSMTEFNTTVIGTKNGYEQRNQNWSTDIRKYNVIEGARKTNKIEDLRYFHKLTRGRLRIFLYKDWIDYKSSRYMSDTIADNDQTIGFGTGTQTEYQLVKNYYLAGASLGDALTTKITRPKDSTVIISVNNSRVSNYIIDDETGIITFDVAPPLNHKIMAGYEYYVPCRFDTDSFMVNFDTYNISSSKVDVIEVRE